MLMDVSQNDNESAKVMIELLNATMEENWWKAKAILKNHKDASTKVINKNGDTILHLAVRAGKNYFVKQLLNFIEDGSKIKIKNKRGHTALHSAVIVDNKQAAELLVNKSNELLYVSDDESSIPLVFAYYAGQINTFLYLHGVTTKGARRDFVNSSFDNDHFFVCNLLAEAASAKQYNLALKFLKIPGTLALATKDDKALLALTANFPPELGIWEALICPSSDGVSQNIVKRGSLSLYSFENLYKKAHAILWPIINLKNTYLRWLLLFIVIILLGGHVQSVLGSTSGRESASVSNVFASENDPSILLSGVATGISTNERQTILQDGRSRLPSVGMHFGGRSVQHDAVRNESVPILGCSGLVRVTSSNEGAGMNAVRATETIHPRNVPMSNHPRGRRRFRMRPAPSVNMGTSHNSADQGFHDTAEQRPDGAAANVEDSTGASVPCTAAMPRSFGAGPSHRHRLGPPSEYRRFGSCCCVCRYCHARFWFEERLSTSTRRTGPLYSHCCRGGTVRLNSPRMYSPYIQQLYSDPHFMNNMGTAIPSDIQEGRALKRNRNNPIPGAQGTALQMRAPTSTPGITPVQ